MAASGACARRDRASGESADRGAHGAVFLTAKDEPRKRSARKASADARPAICGHCSTGPQAEFAALTDKLAHVRLAEASAAVLALADAVQADYERRKRAEAALDYDDLIVKTQNLLSRADAAAWVLYKIDGGIDHILVDEAQDTNPAQWAIIEALAVEFFAGQRRERQAAHAVRRRRREAVDLLLPGRRSHAVRRDGPRLQATGAMRSV